MVISGDYDRILRVLTFDGENNYLLSMIFYRKSLFKFAFGQKVFHCQLIFIFLQHILQTKCIILHNFVYSQIKSKIPAKYHYLRLILN